MPRWTLGILTLSIIPASVDKYGITTERLAITSLLSLLVVAAIALLFVGRARPSRAA